VPTAVVDATHWIAAMQGGARLVTITAGRAQAVTPAGLPVGPNARIDTLSFATPTKGWATVVAGGCEPRRGCRVKAAAFATHDGGRTWAALSPP
jgi:hypothetical protein